MSGAVITMALTKAGFGARATAPHDVKQPIAPKSPKMTVRMQKYFSLLLKNGMPVRILFKITRMLVKAHWLRKMMNP